MGKGGFCYAMVPWGFFFFAQDYMLLLKGGTMPKKERKSSLFLKKYKRKVLLRLGHAFMRIYMLLVLQFGPWDLPPTINVHIRWP